MPRTWLTAPCRVPIDSARQAAAERQATLTKPAGSLGELETLAITLAGLSGSVLPSVDRLWISVFAADHGIATTGVSAYPQAVTAQMVLNFARGGAAISVLARELHAHLEVVDVGVVGAAFDTPGVIHAKVAPGTSDFTQGPAMLPLQLDAALLAGRGAVARSLEAGSDIFIGGEMGIGNTTAASALLAAMLGVAPELVVGPGTGVDAAGIARKTAAVRSALERHHNCIASGEPLAILAAVGGFEIAALAGAYVACAQVGLPVIVDGFIAGAAALVAVRCNPAVRPWLLFGHRSAEPAHALLLETLEAKPIVNFGMRLGEGSGAAVALGVLRLACTLHGSMATFSQAGVSERC